MIRPRLSFLWALSILGAALVPLGVAGWVALDVLERSIAERVRAAQEQVAISAGAVLVDHIEDGKRKLAALARLLEDAADPREQTARLDRLLDPPDIFLEVGCWTAEPVPRVQVQGQTPAYNASQLENAQRDFDAGLSQRVMRLSHEDPVIAVPSRGEAYVAGALESSGGIRGLSISVPGPRASVLVGVLDLSPLRDIFARFSGAKERSLSVLSARDDVIVASGADFSVEDPIQTELPAGHSDWRIVVREPKRLAFAPLVEARRGVLLGFGLAFALCLILAFLFAAIVLRPVRALARTAEKLGSGDLAARSGIARTDEIGQLATAFDRMAADLQELDRLKSEFVAHVSHELRTPLTSAKLTLANVEENLAGPAALARVRADLDRLVHLVDELLDLARVEAGIQLVLRPARLDEVVSTAVESLRPLARVQLGVAGQGETIPIDAARVHQIVVNLVDNAIKHAKSRVDVVTQGREVRVADDGPGVPVALRERIFDGFVRLDSAASTQGFGLGLAIARKLARLHGATLVCEGRSFVLRF